MPPLMPLQPATWSWESRQERRKREMENLQRLRTELTPLLQEAETNPLALQRAQMLATAPEVAQAAADYKSRLMAGVRSHLAGQTQAPPPPESSKPKKKKGRWDRFKGAVGELFEDVGRGALKAGEVALSGEKFQEALGIDTGYMDWLRDQGLIGKGVAFGIDTLTSPATLVTLGAGSQIAGGLKAATAGTKLATAGRAAGALVEPAVSGSLGSRALAETAMGIGAGFGSEAAAELAEDLPGPLRTAAAIGGGIAGGVAGLNAPRAYRAGLGPEGAAVRGLANLQGRPGKVPAIGGMVEETPRPDIGEALPETPPNAVAPQHRAAAATDELVTKTPRPEVESETIEPVRPVEPEAELVAETPAPEPLAEATPEAPVEQTEAPAATAQTESLLDEAAEQVAERTDEQRLPFMDDGREPPDVPPPDTPSLGGPGGRYLVAPIGDEGVRTAIAAKDEALRQPGALAKMPPIFRKGAALLNPSLDQDRQVFVAYNARQAVRNDLATRFDTAMAPYVEAVEKAMTETPAQYIGPADNPIAGTFKDIADNPQFYLIPPPLREALDAYDQAQWNLVSNVARAEYGVDVRPYASGTERAVYAPTVASKDATEAKVDAVAAALGARQRAKHRIFESAYERIKQDPDFVPETDIRELTALHNRAMASNAANRTFQLGAGGRTKTEVIDELHPGLRQSKERMKQRLANARARLQTALQQEGLAERDIRLHARDQRRLARRMAPLQNKMETLLAQEEYGPELSHLAGQVYELRRMQFQLEQARRGATGKATASSAKVDRLRSEIDRLQDEVTKLVRAYEAANTDPYVFDRATSRYYTPEAAKSITELMKVPHGFGRQVIDVMDEVRATHLAGDASPIFVQGMLALLQDPIMVIRTIGGMVGENPRRALERIAFEEADDVAEYSFATGRRFGQPIIEMPTRKGIARIPTVGDLEDSMFALVQRVLYEQWKHDRDLLLRMNPEMSRNVAAHEAANALSKLVPGLNPAERGVSQLRAGVERAALTSTSFAVAPALLIKDATAGLVKLGIAAGKVTDPMAAWRTLDGREQLAVMRALTMTGSLLTISAVSAAAAAPSRGKDPMAAVREALNPNSRYFMALQIGKGHSIPIGGPFRSFIKAVAPGKNGVPLENFPQWAYSKVNSPLKAPLDLFRNRDWRGRPIRQGDFSSQVLDTLRYVFENVAPTSISGMSEAQREGASLGEIAAQGAGSLLGANPSLASPTEQLDQIAREFIDPTTGKPNGKGFYESEPFIRDAIKKQHPELWEKAVAAGSEKRQRAEQLRVEMDAQQAARDQAFLAGTMSREDWAESYKGQRDELNARLKEIYGDEPLSEKDLKTPLDRYRYAIQQAEDPTTGIVDWAAVDAWLAEQPAEDRAYIERNTGLSGTPLVRLYRALTSEYYDLPIYKGYTAAQGSQIQQLVAAARSYQRGSSLGSALTALTRVVRQLGIEDEAVIKGARRVLLGLLKPTKEREQWRKKRPESALFFGSGPLTPKEIVAVQAALRRYEQDAA